MVLVGPAAGVFVDRWDRRRTMLAMDALRAVLVLLLLPVSVAARMLFGVAGLSLAAAQIAFIYVVVFLASVSAQFFGPARVAIIADVVDEPLRPQAASLTQVTSSLAMIVGPALAAPLFFGFGIRWALILDALSFVASGVGVYFVRPVRAVGGGDAVRPGGFWHEFTEGLRFFAGNRVLMTLLVSSLIVMLGAGALNALSFFFLTENLHASPERFGIVGMTFGGGTLAGAVLASMLVHRVGLARVFSLATIAVGLLVLVYARMDRFAPAVVVLFLLGAVIPALQIALGPLVLQVTPRELIGRVVAVMGPTTSIAEMASMLVAGFLASTALRDFHATVAGVTFGRYDAIFTVTGILAVGGGGYAAVMLRGVDARAPRHGAA